MSDFRTADALRALLGLYEGVRIGRIRCHPSGYTSVQFQVAQPASLVRLAHCAENANLGLCVWSRFQGVTVEGSGFNDGPWYELRAQADLPGSEIPSTAQMFCGYLVHDLTSHGVLEESQGDQLLAGWGWSE